MTEPGQTRGPRRWRGPLVLGVVALLAVGVVAIRHEREEGRSEARGDGTGLAQEKVSSGASNTDGATPDEASLDSLARAHEGQSGAERPLPNAAQDQSSYLVVGQLDDSRVIALSTAAAIRQAAKGPSKRIEVQAASPTVGGPVWTRVHGSDLLIASTNHAQFVRLRGDWRTRDVLDIAPAVNLRIPIEYGPILAVGSLEVVLSVTDAFHFALARIDVDSWTVTKTRMFEDRSAVVSAACATDDAIFVSTDAWIDKYDSRTFDRLASVKRSGDWASALACQGDALYAVSSLGPKGWSFDTRNLRETGSFKWEGDHGGPELVIDGDELVGTDQVDGRVFACDRRNLRCRTSKVVAKKATNVLVYGDSIFVTDEAAVGLVVLNRQTLKKVGFMALPARPRTLALLNTSLDS